MQAQWGPSGELHERSGAGAAIRAPEKADQRARAQGLASCHTPYAGQAAGCHCLLPAPRVCLLQTACPSPGLQVDVESFFINAYYLIPSSCMRRYWNGLYAKRGIPWFYWSEYQMPRPGAKNYVNWGADNVTTNSTLTQPIDQPFAQSWICGASMVNETTEKGSWGWGNRNCTEKNVFICKISRERQLKLMLRMLAILTWPCFAGLLVERRVPLGRHVGHVPTPFLPAFAPRSPQCLQLHLQYQQLHLHAQHQPHGV